MHQYGMSSYYIDVVVADFSYPLWRSNLRIDAIITDRKYLIVNISEHMKFAEFQDL
jgi:tRNA (guanine10-N2)-methyltransferase